MAEKRDYYEVLGVEKGADKKEIKKETALPSTLLSPVNVAFPALITIIYSSWRKKRALTKR